jgi:hypothetical protein
MLEAESSIYMDRINLIPLGKSHANY